MMKHTLLYIAVSGMTLLTSCQLGKHYVPTYIFPNN